MIVFLTSSPSGPLDNSRAVNGLDEMNGFAERLRSVWKDRARCLMITASPDAFGDNDEMTEFFGHAVRKQGMDWEVFDLWDHRTEDFSMEKLHSYDVVFLGGGHVPTQNRFFGEIGLRDKMKGFGGTVVGISAGTMNSADAVYAQPELPGEAADPGYQRFLTGLGLTQTQILPHYQMVRDNYLDGLRLYEDITFGDSFGRRFLVLPDGSYLLSVNGQETVYGEAYEIRDGVMTQICGTDGNVEWKI